MISQELINYIKQELARGTDREDIKKALSDAGWQLSDIEEGFMNIGALSIQLAQSPVIDQSYHKKSKKLFVVVLVVIIGLAVIMGAAFFVLSMLNNNSASAQDIPPFDDSDLRVQNIDVPDEQNAFFEFNKIKDAKIKFPAGYADDPDDKEKNGRQLIRNISERKIKDEKLASEIVSLNQDLIKGFDEMDKKTSFKDPFVSNINEIDFNSKFSAVNPANIYTITQIKAVKIFLLADQGKNEEALNEAMKIISFGQKMKEGQTMLVPKLMGIGIQSIGLDAVKKTVADLTLTNEIINKYLQEIVVLKDFTDALKSSIKEEIYLTRANTIDLMHKEGLGALKENIFGNDPRIIEGFKNPKYFQPNKTKLMFAEDAREQIDYINLPCGISSAKKSKTELKVSAIQNEIKNGIFFFFYENAIGKVIYALTALTLDFSKRKCDAEFPIATTKAFIAMKMYQNDNGQLPQTIDELVPKYLQAVPMDPYDGKSLKYSKEKKIIYGVGMDGVDNAGSGDDQNIQINF